ncbi:MAG TPA: hypothetical protein VI702_02350 [Nitrospiria bacterium]
MKTALRAFSILALLVSTAEARSGPYVQVETGIMARDVVEEDPAITGFKFEGGAVSTRLMVRLGLVREGVVDFYLQGGAADLSIDEFDRYAGKPDGAFGGGLRVYLFQSPYRGGLSLFFEGNALRFSTRDRHRISVTCTAAHGCPANDLSSIDLMADEAIQWNEYAALIGGSSRYDNMAPYGGIRLSMVDGQDRIRSETTLDFPNGFNPTPDLSEKDNFGIFLGTYIFLDRSETTALNFEVTLVDQNSFKAAIRRTF